MILVPSATPPPPPSSSLSFTNCSHTQNMPASAVAQTGTSPAARVDTTSKEQQVVRAVNLKIPTVTLDAQVVTHPMAAALSTSLLGHVLFLKSQIPLYVMNFHVIVLQLSQRRSCTFSVPLFNFLVLLWDFQILAPRKDAKICYQLLIHSLHIC